MKNTILILIAALMAIAGLLALASSSSDYAAEKLFYRAMKLNREIVLNPDVAPPGMLQRVERGLQKIVQKYAKSKITKQAHLVLAEFYFNNKEYKKALATLDVIIAAYSDDRPVLSQAHFLKGNAYEKQNRWEEALREYRFVRDKYPDTLLALEVPLYIGNYYKKKNNFEQAKTAYHEAAIFYKQMEAQNRGKPAGYASASLLLQAYVELNDYEQAGQMVEEIIQSYPQLLPLIQQAANIEVIFIKNLNKPEKAIELFTLIKTKTDNPQLIEALEKKIEFLKAQKKF